MTVQIEGLSPDEILELPDDWFDQLIFDGRPVILNIGSAELLGEFRISDNTLIVELAQIDGGGEGVLPTLASVIERYAKRRGLNQIEWLVYATNCAKPNLRLKRMLERRGFEITHVPERATAISVE